jgi:ubiquinone biosynthesis protein
MWLLNLRQNFRTLARLIEIIWHVVTHFIRDFSAQTRLFRPFRRKARTEEDARRNTPEVRIRELIEDLGPTFVKFGQILADRPDLVSEKLRAELRKLQATARPIPDSEAIQLIEHELGGPFQIFFQTMELKCLASASIGQVYQGVLKNGEKVALKIQRPGIVPKIKIDVKLLKLIASYTASHYPELATLNLVAFVDEFGASLLEELNYHSEARNILRFTELMKNQPAFYAPKLYQEFTTQRLLVMEFIEGIPPDRIDRLVAEGYDLKKIAENGANIVLEMVLKHGVFHADPHAGNIFILPGNRVSFIDYGMVAVLRPAHIQFLADFTIAFATGSSKKISHALIKVSGQRFFELADDLEFDVQQTIDRYSYLPWEKVSISDVMMDCITLIIKYQLRTPSSIYMLLKALATISSFGELLDKQFEFSPLLVPYAREIVKREFSPKRFFSDLGDVVMDYIDVLKELPRDVNEILYKAKQGRIVHEISLKEDSKLRRTIRVMSINLALGMVTIILIVCSTILSVMDSSPGMARIQLVAGMVSGAWLMVRSLRRNV